MDMIIDIIKKNKGRKGFICKELGISLSDLNDIIEEEESYKKELDIQVSLRDQLLNDLFDIQLENSLIMKEKWALDYMAVKNGVVADGDIRSIPVSIDIPVRDGKLK